MGEPIEQKVLVQALLAIEELREEFDAESVTISFKTRDATVDCRAVRDVPTTIIVDGRVVGTHGDGA